MKSNHNAPGAPGIEPRWTPSAKDGIGTAYHTQLPPLVHTQPRHRQRDLFSPRRFAEHARPAIPHHRWGNILPRGTARSRSPDGISRSKHACSIGSPTPIPTAAIGSSKKSSPTLILRSCSCAPGWKSPTRAARQAAALRPARSAHERLGQNNSAVAQRLNGRKSFDAQRENIHLVLGCPPDFTRRSVGYVGSSDGWQDLMDNFKMDWEFAKRGGRQHRADWGNRSIARAGVHPGRRVRRSARRAPRRNCCQALADAFRAAARTLSSSNGSAPGPKTNLSRAHGRRRPAVSFEPAAFCWRTKTKFFRAPLSRR